MPGYETLIVGGGIAGLATAWHLARRGARGVALLERDPALGQQSSPRHAAILRTLGGDPLLSELSLRSAEFLYAPPPGFAPEPLVERTGLVLVADAASAERLATWVAAVGGRSGAEPLTRARLAALAPHFRADAALAYAFPREGRIAIGALVEGFARGAAEGGVALRTGADVAALLVAERRVSGVRLADGTEIRAERTVLAAGGWAGALGRRAGSRVELRPTRRHLMVTVPLPGVDPRWPVVWQLGAGFYACPERGGLLLCDCDETNVLPERCDVDPDAAARILQAARARLVPAAVGATERLWCAMRTFAADGRFAVGPDPDLAGLFWVAGLGGSGMVCGHELGRLAALSLAGEEDPVRRALDPGRLVGTPV
jgi:glycine/D-amino acid oxidase-like deaminating enzyme